MQRLPDQITPARRDARNKLLYLTNLWAWSHTRNWLLGLSALLSIQGGWASTSLNGPELGPLICGTSSYVDGTYVWTDYAYDDQGAHESGVPGGEATYPEGIDNSADLIQLQFESSPDGLQITAVLQTLLKASLPVLGIGFDTDADPGTGAPDFPGSSWQPKKPLGIDLIVTVSEQHATLRRFSDGKWSKASTFVSTVDSQANTMQATIPKTLAEPDTAVWRVFAGLGIQDKKGSWLDGHSPLYDLAFVGRESPAWPTSFRTGEGAWQDQKQADILAGDLDPEQAAAYIDFTRMDAGVNELASLREPGMHTLLYRSALDLGESVHLFPPNAPPIMLELGFLHRLFAGPYQPYVLWLPQSLPQPAPLVVFMHGTGSTHLAAVSRNWFGPGQFNPSAAVVHPLARGEATGYFGPAEQDVLDVIDDISSRMDIDEDRVILTGWSSGGLATMRLGQLYPDRWSALMPMVGQSRQPESIELQISGGKFFLPNALENLSNLPVRAVSGREDVSKVDSGPDRDELDLFKLGYDHRHWLMLRRAHEVVPTLTNGVLVEALKTPRVRNPARVVYSVEPYLFQSDPKTGLELRYDSAYWASEIRVRGKQFTRGDKGTIDVTSLARADRKPMARRITEYGNNKSGYGKVAGGADLAGPNPWVKGHDRWIVRGLALEPGPPQKTLNGLSAVLTQIDTVTLDLPRMQLRTDRNLTLEVSGDGPSTLSLRGPWSGPVELIQDRQIVDTLEPKDNTIKVSSDFTGSHTFVLRPK